MPWMQSEIQTTMSRIWTQVANPISYNDNHYAKCAFTHTIVCFAKNCWSKSNNQDCGANSQVLRIGMD